MAENFNLTNDSDENEILCSHCHKTPVWHSSEGAYLCEKCSRDFDMTSEEQAAPVITTIKVGQRVEDESGRIGTVTCVAAFDDGSDYTWVWFDVDGGGIYKCEASELTILAPVVETSNVMDKEVKQVAETQVKKSFKRNQKVYLANTDIWGYFKGQRNNVASVDTSERWETRNRVELIHTSRLLTEAEYAAPTVATEIASADGDAPLSPSNWLQRTIEIAHGTPENMRNSAEQAIVELKAENSALKAALEHIESVGTERLSAAIARKALKALNATK